MIFFLSSRIALLNLIMITGSPAALVAHWAFDEGTGTSTADSSGNGFTGAFVGSPAWGSDGVRSSYLTFNGTNTAVNPSFTLPVMTTTNDFSWAFWANSNETATNATQQNSIVVGNRYSGTGTADFTPRQFIKFTATTFEWHQNGVGTDNLDTPNLVTSEWHHHAIVKTGSTLDYYLDGVFNTSKTLTLTPGSAANPVFIGGNPGAGVNEFFNGSIDDVRLYNNALSAQEVAALAVPEPSIQLTLGLAAFGLLAVRRRR